MASGSPKQRGGFRDLLSSYLPGPENPAVVDEEQQAKQRQLDYMTKDLASGNHISATVATSADGQHANLPFGLRLRHCWDQGAEAGYQVSPISLPEAFSQRAHNYRMASWKSCLLSYR